MSIQVIETGEIVEPMTKTEAERITHQIADKLDGIADNFELVMPLIREALTRQAWQALGYTGVSEYVSTRFAAALSRLPRELRRPAVLELAAAGMSTRAIAPVVGVGDSTVQRDIATAPDGAVAPAATTGLNGKTYQRRDPEPQPDEPEVVDAEIVDEPTPAPEPPKPRRRALTDQARDAGWELRKTVERIQRIGDDDRFNRNKEQVTPLLRGHLQFAIEVCQDLLDQLNQSQED